MSILRDNNRHRVTIGENVYCTCSPSQRADRNICCHAVWVYLNLFGLPEINEIIPQVRLDLAQLNILFKKCPDNIPQHLSTCLEKPIKRTFDPMITSHPKCDNEQTWVLQRKPGTKKSTCSGCLKKDKIDPGMLHLSVEGLLYVRRHNNVVQTVLRFCLTRKCVTDIRSKMNNIRNLTSMGTKEHESLSSDPLTASEREEIIKEGFIFV